MSSQPANSSGTHYGTAIIEIDLKSTKQGPVIYKCKLIRSITHDS